MPMNQPKRTWQLGSSGFSVFLRCGTKILSLSGYERLAFFPVQTCVDMVSLPRIVKP